MISELLRGTSLAAGPAADNDFWYAVHAAATRSGFRITPETALTYSAYFACVRVIAEDVSSLPLIVYERTAQDAKRRAVEHPLFDVLGFAPNSRQTAMEFREMMQGFVSSQGNAYAEIVPGPRGFADELVPLRPDRVAVDLNESTGALRYEYERDDGSKKAYREDQMFHLRGWSLDGIVGLSVASLAREGVGTGLAKEGYEARFYQNDATPGGALMHPGKLSKDAKLNLRESFISEHGGFMNRGAPAVFEEGMKWESFGTSHVDAQFLESKDWSIRDICRWFRMKPSKIADLSDATYSNLEQESLDHVTDTIRPPAVRWEQRIRKDLILAPRRYFAEHLFDALLRSDSLSKWSAYQIAIQSEVLSPNEVRRKENMNPRTDPRGDEYRNPNTNTADEGSLGEALAFDVASRTVRRECRAIANASRRYDSEGFENWLRRFAEEHACFLSSALYLPGDAARSVAQRSAEEALEAFHAKRLDPLLHRWEAIKPRELAAAAQKHATNGGAK